MFNYDNKIFKILGSITCLFELMRKPRIVKTENGDTILFNFVHYRRASIQERMDYLSRLNDYLQYLVDNNLENAKEINMVVLNLSNILNVDYEDPLNIDALYFYLKNVLKSKVAIRDNTKFRITKIYLGYNMWYDLKNQKFSFK